MRASRAALALAVVTVGCLLAGAPAHAADPAAADPTLSAGALGTLPDEVDPAVTVIGAPGLRWSDLVSTTPVPGLWLMARESAMGSLSVRTAQPTACPADGWLTLNSGARSLAPRPDGQCLALPAPVTEPGGLRVPNWTGLTDPNDDYFYDPIWGTLAGARPGATAPTPDEARCAVGPGAAIALADSAGTVRATYAATLSDLPAGACAQLLVIDAGVLPLGAARDAALRGLDSLVAHLRAVHPGGALLVAGIGDSDPDSAHLSAVLAEPGNVALTQLRRGWLRTETTRQTGMVTIVDLTPTLLNGPIPDDLDGATLTARQRTESTPAVVRELNQRDIAAGVVRDSFVAFFTVFVAGQLLLYLGAALALRAGRISRRTAARTAATTGLVFGSVPVASVLINLVPWRAAGHPGLALWLLLIATAVIITVLAVAGPWRRRPYGPAGAIAALTIVTFAADVALGSRLQINALFGLSPLIAGRFHGFGNIAFAVFAMATLIAMAALAAILVRHSTRVVAGLAVAALGAVAVAFDGWPGLGADFGGVLALVPGVAILSLGVAAARLNLARLVGIAVLAVGTAAAIAVLDWTRPADARSHLGRFVQDVIDGDGLSVLGRKLDANLGLFADFPLIGIATVPILALVLTALTQPQKLGLHALARAQDQDPVLRPLLVACLSTALIGFAVNDSGVIVPATALTAAGPLLVTVWARLWAQEHDAAPAPGAGQRMVS
ncbi:MAG: hypothetical protein ACT4P1_02975 [Sporichthyaceae bacterium]